MKRTPNALLPAAAVFSVLSLGLMNAPAAHAQTLPLIAVGTLDQSRAGSFADLSGLKYTLENGVPANNLGGFGSAIAYASGNTFLALPDRGPNAVSFNSAIDDTVSYVNRFHTITMNLSPNKSGSGLPYTLTPELRETTLLWSLSPLVYGSGEGLDVGSGAPKINNYFQHFFTGRSDNFNPKRNSGDPNDARFDSEGMRLSNDGRKVYISDEYGPYVYEFDRATGLRLRSFKLPKAFYVTNLSPVGDTEIADNAIGRTANKGMEGLAITPDGRTLVGIMQNALIQDANEGGDAANLLRLVTIDIASGRVTHQFGYLLTKGSGVSEMVALNNHEFLVDERDGHGRADASNAKVKQLFKIDLDKATDIGEMDGTTAAQHTVAKTLFVDLVKSMEAGGFSAAEIPAKIEGVAFGADLKEGKSTVHTLWIANDNDFLETVLDANGNTIANPNQFFVFTFTDADLGGSKFVPQDFDRSCR
ncbi:esterase-like activity of phytase family protein [Silvibacterium acidisoli]|uniref:esterase-like activity of phytase family protein n=1 Tax=Acidobacteriaceae bacterium ZG23-2 TaxID=2883246 RepID=UPI00406C5DE1